MPTAEQRYWEEDPTIVVERYALESKAMDADNEEEEADEEDEFDNKSHLQPYSLADIDKRVFIQKVEGKGRCLFAKVPMKPGDIIFVEAAVLAATPSTDRELWTVLSKLNEEEQFVLPPVWHLGAITSLTKLDLQQQRVIQDKFVPEPDSPPGRDVMRILEHTGIALDPKKYERALNAWRFNGFGHHADDDGLILYNRISNMAHSCGASATWHYADNDAFVLRARRQLEIGDEITISYVNDEDLYQPVHIRRVKLSSWQFTCHCRRCDDPVDSCRGFLCPACATGTVFLKTDVSGEKEDEYYTTASTCTVCNHDFDEDEIRRYEELESSYVNRLEETSKDQLVDAECVYQEACRVFTQHHVLYELDTILYQAYAQLGLYHESAKHMERRIEFLARASPKVSLTQAGLWEELGDVYMKLVEGQSAITGWYKNVITRCYENAFNALIVLCGADHDYTIAAHSKFLQVSQMEHLDASAINVLK